MGWQIGIEAVESLIRGKSREEKTNNQFEPPVRFNGTYTQVWGAVFVHKSTGAVGELWICIRGGFNGTNPRASTPQSAETAKFCAEICGTNLWPFLIVLWRRHFTNLQYTHFQTFFVCYDFQCEILFCLSTKCLWAVADSFVFMGSNIAALSASFISLSRK